MVRNITKQDVAYSGSVTCRSAPRRSISPLDRQPPPHEKKTHPNDFRRIGLLQREMGEGLLLKPPDSATLFRLVGYSAQAHGGDSAQAFNNSLDYNASMSHY